MCDSFSFHFFSFNSSMESLTLSVLFLFIQHKINKLFTSSIQSLFMLLQSVGLFVDLGSQADQRVGA